MRFTIHSEVFKRLPTLCIGVVVVEGIDNRRATEQIEQLRQQAIIQARGRLQGSSLKEHPAIAVYRDAFRLLGFNPNKFPSSIEALASRVVKGGEPPRINPLVDLVNAVSLKHLLPMGAHDLDSIAVEMAVRFSAPGEPFTPLGGSEPEEVPAGELVYADQREIRTRRWIWRQNDRGKVTESTSRIFILIDGFTNHNREAVEESMRELAHHLQQFFGSSPRQWFLYREHQTIEI